MTDGTSDVEHARAALNAPASVLDTHLLGAVHHGLLSVPVESPGPHDVTSRDGARRDDMPQLAIRRRGAV